MRTFVIPVIVSILILGGLGFSQEAEAASFIAEQDGDWSDPATWGDPTGPLPGVLDDVTIPSGKIVTVSGFIGLVAITITNFGTITITNSGTFNLDFGFPSISNSGTINNSGNINVSSGTTINNDGTINNSGTIRNFEAGTINNNVGGIITNSGDINNDGTINNNGTIDNDDSGDINNDRFIINSGDINNNVGGSITNSGTITNNVGGTINNNVGGIITNNVGGTINSLFDIPSTLNNFGTIISNSGIIDNSGGIFNNFGTIIRGSLIICGGGTTLNTTTDECEADVTQDDLDLLQGIIDGLELLIANISVVFVQPILDAVLDTPAISDDASLTRTLERSLSTLERADGVACKGATSFVDDVNALLADGIIDQDEAGTLIDRANALLANCT